MAGPGGAHGRLHGTHRLSQEGTDQGGFAAGPRAEHHHHQISPFQLRRHLAALTLQGLAHHLILHQLQLPPNAVQVFPGGFPFGVEGHGEGLAAGAPGLPGGTAAALATWSSPTSPGPP